MFDDLEQFKDWWLGLRPMNTPQKNIITNDADTHGIVLYRQEPYQVELFNIEPNSVIHPHIHPNVDSFEVYLGGDVTFMCNDVWYEQNKIGDCIRVLPSSYHGGKFGERGGCFFSIQKWLNGVEPQFVGNDWSDKKGSQSYKESTKG